MTRTLPFPRPLWALLLFPSIGCRSAPPTPESTYRAVISDLDSSRGGGLRPQTLARQTERFERVLAWADDESLVTTDDHLFAALTLTLSDQPPHLVRAQELAIRAAELGEERGFTVQAHATDRLMVLRHERYQRYGTVIIYEPFLRRHQLYPVDPTTTDAIRRSMGVPTLAQLLVEVDVLNGSEITRRLRGEIQDGELPPGNETPRYPVDEITGQRDG